MNRKGSKAGKYLIIVGIILPLTMTGCGERPQEMKDTVLTEMVGERGGRATKPGRRASRRSTVTYTIRQQKQILRAAWK